MAFIGHPESCWLPQGIGRRVPVGEARQVWRRQVEQELATREARRQPWPRVTVR